MQIRQTQKLTQKLVLTPQMRQSLRILQMPILELKEHIEKEIEENPVLEGQQNTNQETISENVPQEDSASDFFYQNYPAGDYANELHRKKDYKESLITKPVTLQEVLLKQLRMCKLKTREQFIAEFIIHQIDDNGYLTFGIDEIVSFLNAKKMKQEEKITAKLVNEMLTIIQGFEPTGVGARNLKECLILQLKAKGKTNTLMHKIIKHHLADVAKNKTRVIAKKLKVKPNKVLQAIGEIAHLEPKPGRLYSPIPFVSSSSYYPDIVLEKTQSGYDINITSWTLPKFRISRRYKNILKSARTSKETKQYIRQKLKSAQDLEKAISQRDETLKGVTQHLLEIQKEFFKHGDISRLKPLTYKKIAQLVRRNESTISRVVNSKYMKTPFGIFKLNFFFTKPLKNTSENTLSREFIKSKIFNIIAEESKRSPLNDTKIAKLLAKENLRVARRTVSKYREELRIPPAHRRKPSKK